MKEIPLTKGKVALVDDEDYEYLSKFKWHHWGAKTLNYAKRTVDRKYTIVMHRVIMCAKKGEMVDHINSNGLDNRKVNLRLTNHAGNNMNVSKRKGTKNRYKGVHKRHQRYSAQIGLNGKIHHLGTFDTENEAVIAYNNKAIEFFGEFAKLNILNNDDNNDSNSKGTKK